MEKKYTDAAAKVLGLMASYSGETISSDDAKDAIPFFAEVIKLIKEIK